MKIAYWRDSSGGVVGVAVVLTEKDKANISNMHPDATVYAMLKDGMPREVVDQWMDRVKAGSEVIEVAE